MPNDDQHSLDPEDWSIFRKNSHQMLDDMIDYIKDIRSRPVWQPIPNQVRMVFQESLPILPTDLQEIHKIFLESVLPYSVGNVHPGFMGWVHGGGTPVGMIAEMLAAGLNANVGGRDQIPLEVERQIVHWMRELFCFPEHASGLFVTGSSMANYIAILVARTSKTGTHMRQTGLQESLGKWVAYSSQAVHSCVSRAMDFAGFGSNSLKKVSVNVRHEIDIQSLGSLILQDKKEGLQPFLVVGSAGTVDTGAIDDLQALSEIAKRESIWFHVDGAYGALGMLAKEIAPRLKGIELADSIALDFHKWGQVPYDAGFVLVRDPILHWNTFSTQANYLQREIRGLAGNSPWPCDFGPDLSRGFRALKTWFTLKVYGTEALGKMISETCKLAHYLESKIISEEQLEILAPVSLNIVCFRYRARNSDQVNANIVMDLQELGQVAPSSTRIHGKLAIRAAIFNHRTSFSEIDTLVSSVLKIGKFYSEQKKNEP
ncbi:aromatic-L-amino-acid/L-tryptophan decarboxylase [Gammaproteobacteria bacterium]